MQTQLLGQPVKHISFGKGIITEISAKVVTIHFSQGEKKFLYPQAFSKFLTLRDTEKQKEINAKYNKMLRDEEEAQKRVSEEQERLHQLRTMKIIPNSQAVFNVAFNEAQSIIECSTISTGCYLSGHSKGEPRIPKKINPNSVCLLTGLPESKEEKDRYILGAFMVGDNFWGKHCRNGIVNGHEKHRVCLPSDVRLPYWNYFEHSETFPHWGNVPFKYFANSTMQKILLNMIDLLVDTEQELAVKEFYQYFCEINRLPIEQSKIGEKL